MRAFRLSTLAYEEVFPSHLRAATVPALAASATHACMCARACLHTVHAHVFSAPTCVKCACM